MRLALDQVVGKRVVKRAMGVLLRSVWNQHGNMQHRTHQVVPELVREEHAVPGLVRQYPQPGHGRSLDESVQQGRVP